MQLHAQGATEYLVLLAVVLIVALVSVALLGFFPGMASDAQITQSQMYWQSATPIAIVESTARYWTANGLTYPYFRVRNTGMYPIRITGIIGADGNKATQFWTNIACGGVPSGGYWNIGEYFYLAPGEEKSFAANYFYNVACNRDISATTGSPASNQVGGASSVCQNSNASPGMLDYNSIGFEYIQYIEGQQVTKRQVGRDFIVKCGPPA